MENRIRDLLEIIRRETDLYRELLAHAQQKTPILVGGSLEDLLESNKIEETQSIKLRLLDQECGRIILDFSRFLNIPREEFRLSMLIRCTDDAGLCQELGAQAASCTELARQLQVVHQQNRKLIESSLHFSKGLLDFISNATGSYQDSGHLRNHATTQPTLSHHV